MGWSEEKRVNSVNYCAFVIFQRSFTEGNESVGLMDKGWTSQWGNLTLSDGSSNHSKALHGQPFKQEELALRKIRAKHLSPALFADPCLSIGALESCGIKTGAELEL